MRAQDDGFTLVEVLVALSILLVAALSTAQVLTLATTALHDSRVRVVTTVFAAQRVEQLLAAEWATLLPSPPNALDANVAGYVDFLDADGQVIGGGAVPPPAAVLVRRWSIQPPAIGSPDARVICVRVRSLAADRAGAHGARGETVLMTVRAKVGP